MVLIKPRKFLNAEDAEKRRDSQSPALRNSLRFSASFALLSVRIFENCEDFGLRWQSAAATPFFDCGQSFQCGVAPALRDSRRSPKRFGCCVSRAMYSALK